MECWYDITLLTFLKPSQPFQTKHLLSLQLNNPILPHLSNPVDVDISGFLISIVVQLPPHSMLATTRVVKVKYTSQQLQSNPSKPTNSTSHPSEPTNSASRKHVSHCLTFTLNVCYEIEIWCCGFLCVVFSFF